jgi:hypothetical protein
MDNVSSAINLVIIEASLVKVKVKIKVKVKLLKSKSLKSFGTINPPSGRSLPRSKVIPPF